MKDYKIQCYLVLTETKEVFLEAESEEEARDILDDELEEYARQNEMCLLNYDIEEINEVN